MDQPPLHYDEGEEVHARRLVEQAVGQLFGVAAKLEGHRGERHSFVFQVPERPEHVNFASVARIKNSTEGIQTSTLHRPTR